MIKREYEIEKKKKTTTTTNKRKRMRMIREWVGVTVFTNYIFFFLNPQKLLRWLVVIGVISLPTFFTKC